MEVEMDDGELQSVAFVRDNILITYFDVDLR